MSKGKRHNLERLLRSASERQEILRIQNLEPANVPLLAGKTTWERLLEFSEHGWVMWAVGTVGTLLGFFYTPVLAVCGVAIVLAFHRVGVVRGQRKRIQIPAYAALFLITTLALYEADVAIKKNLPHVPTVSEIAKAIVSLLPQAPPSPTALHSAPPTQVNVKPTEDTDIDKIQKWTLHDLFKTDFTVTLRSSDTLAEPIPGLKVPIEFSVNVDMNTRTKFLMFYIPASPRTYDLCVKAANLSQDIARKYPPVAVQGRTLGDSSGWSSADAAFNGVVYVYHETDLTTDDIRRLTDGYKTLGLSPVFRTSDYLEIKKYEAIKKYRDAMAKTNRQAQSSPQ
jgi:hypothetical protein